MADFEISVEVNETIVGGRRQYVVCEKLSAGSISACARTRDKVALKIFRKTSQSEAEMSLLVGKLKEINYEGLNTVLECFEFDLNNNPCHVVASNFMYFKSVADVMQTQYDGKLPCSFLPRIIFGISDALAFLHSKGIVHKNLKPSNVLVKSFNKRTSFIAITLSEFGISPAKREGVWHLVRDITFLCCVF